MYELLTRNWSFAATTTPIHKEISERGLLLPTEPDFKGNFQVASAAAALTITMRSVVVIIIIMLKWREKWEHVCDNLEMERGTEDGGALSPQMEKKIEYAERRIRMGKRGRARLGSSIESIKR